MTVRHSVLVEACCTPDIDDDDSGRLIDALPATAGAFSIHDGTLATQFDVEAADDLAVLSEAMAVMGAALRSIGFSDIAHMDATIAERDVEPGRPLGPDA